jgi:putative NIF3 family GTP cyclohydrolase 1 type 2
MNHQDIIRMAREACDQAPREDWNSNAWVFGDETLERFAALVAAEKEKQIIDILERLQQRNDSHNYYAYAINVIKGETHENPYLYTIRL